MHPFHRHYHFLRLLVHRVKNRTIHLPPIRYPFLPTSKTPHHQRISMGTNSNVNPQLDLHRLIQSHRQSKINENIYLLSSSEPFAPMLSMLCMMPTCIPTHHIFHLMLSNFNLIFKSILHYSFHLLSLTFLKQPISGDILLVLTLHRKLRIHLPSFLISTNGIILNNFIVYFFDPTVINTQLSFTLMFRLTKFSLFYFHLPLYLCVVVLCFVLFCFCFFYLDFFFLQFLVSCYANLLLCCVIYDCRSLLACVYH
jgi:hypothetical protein